MPNKFIDRTGERHHEWLITDYRGWRDVDILSTTNNYFKSGVTYSDVKRNRIKNPLIPSVYGVGFLGVGDHKAFIGGKTTRIYETWRHMLYRCYKSNAKAYEGCCVSSEWHNFQQFCEDFPNLEGYDLWLNNKNYQIDKDLKIPGNRVYCKNSCKLVSQKENTAAGVRPSLRKNGGSYAS
jgi:hypothetical protein